MKELNMGECFLVAGYRHTDHDLSTAEAELKTADADVTSYDEVAVSVLLALVKGKFGFST
jgi:hypothetical protein